MNDTDSKELRLRTRVQTVDQFLVEFRQAGRKFYEKGYGSDLSLGGARFSTLVKFKPAEVVDLVISFSPQYPGKIKRIQTRAEVVYTKAGRQSFYQRVGCKFQTLDAADQLILEDFLTWAKARAQESQPAGQKGGGNRNAKRIMAEDKFVIEFIEGNKKYLDKGYGCDLSLSGVSVNTLAPLEKDTSCRMAIYFHPEFSGPKKLVIAGKVVRSDQVKQSNYRRIAFQFNPNPEVEQGLSQFLSWVEEQEKKSRR